MILGSFFATFIVASNVIESYLIRRNTVEMTHISNQFVWVVAFVRDRAVAFHLNELAAFKLENPDYTFRVSIEKINNYNKQLEQSNAKPLLQINAADISETKQSIIVSSTAKGSTFYRYEVTDNEIVPMKYSEIGLIDAFWIFFGSITAGALAAFVSLKTFKMIRVRSLDN
mgnify:CR=1 FL=1